MKKTSSDGNRKCSGQDYVDWLRLLLIKRNYLYKHTKWQLTFAWVCRSLSLGVLLKIIEFCSKLKGREERKRRRREDKEKKVTRAGIKPTAAAPSQLARQDVSRSDHSAGSKESASWRALRQQFGLTRSMGVGQREKEGKEARKREQPGRTGAGERRKAAEKRQDRNSFVQTEEI